MNLVKAQALANDLPPDMLKKYADGFDPRIIPPWIATGTLQAKMDLNKRMQNMMGGAQGEQPSVKEQIEQKAGLMAANTMQQRQQQAQQQMAMAQRPGPAPAGVPQPEDQPEAPTQMASGGLASVPVEFAFKPGGIVGFSDGGGARVHPQAQLIEFLKQMGLTPEEFTKAPPKVQNEIREMMRAGAAAPAPAASAPAAQPAKGSALRNLNPAGVAGYGFGLYHGELGAGEEAELERRRKMAPTIDKNVTEETMKRVGPMTAPTFKDPRMAGSGVPSAAQQGEAPAPAPDRAAPPAQTAQVAQPAQTGLAAAANRSPYFAQADADIAKPIAAPTTAGILAEQKALSPQAMQEETMRQRYEERKARADQERAAFEKTRPSGLDDLIRVFGQAGQYKGMSGLAPAYTANQQQKRAEELALEKRMNELYTAADTQEFAGAKELFESRTGAMKEANRSYQDRLKSRTETLAQLANVDQRSIDAALNRLTEVQVQQMRMAQSKADAARPGEGERFAAKYLGLIAEGKVKDAEAYKDAFLLGKRGEPKEDTFAKELAKKEIEIATSVMPDEMKAKQLAGIQALKQRQGGGGATVTVGGKTYTFPTQEAANKFKAEAGVK